jgi:biopolymer transport protein ExbD
MKLRRPDPRPHMETIVAMIDVVFFLLVFFILIGRYDASSPFEVVPPLGLSGADLPAGGVIVAVSPDGRHALDGIEMPPEAVIEALVARAVGDPDLPVRVKAHHAAPLGLVLPLVARLEEAGLRDIGLVVTPNPP